jgi:hypothetical protein
MGNRTIAIFGITMLACVGVITAQSTPTKSSSAPRSAGRSAVLKPLTPKSAMPAAHKSSLAMPKVTSTGNTTAELTRMERTNTKPASSKSSTAPATKLPTTQKAAPANPEINFQYQKTDPKKTASTQKP